MTLGYVDGKAINIYNAQHVEVQEETMPVKVNKIKETTAVLHDGDGKVVGTIRSHLQLNDVRLQIKKQKLNGYYIKWKKYGLLISNTGHLDEWPKGFFDTMDDQLLELLGW